jgi:lipopolysaccharide/colanic/teichoic acid biosynthesis glycosyltransferase
MAIDQAFPGEEHHPAGRSASKPRVEGSTATWASRAAKRALDLVLTTAMLLVLAIPMVIIALAVRLTSPGPALFRSTRTGQDHRPFTMLKFRSMYRDADDEVHRTYVTAMLTGGVEPGNSQAKYKLTQDPRVTRLGAFLRRMSLDELPQLLNVLKGDMSLVGPRPLLPYEVDLVEARFRSRFEVKPGITGLWQVSGRSNLTMVQALELDERYVRERSFGLDVSILVRTVPVVLLGRGVS